MSIIKYNLKKLEEQAHNHRRVARSKKYLAIDGDNEFVSLNKNGEAMRKKIKSEDNNVQKNIEKFCEELKSVQVNGVVEPEEFFPVRKKLAEYGCF